jgi:hypothetical protein
MLKKIALAGIFAVVSIISFGSSTVVAARAAEMATPFVGTPIMKGISPCGALRCH